MTIGYQDITFHYPPELFNLLVDAIPLLNRSKRDLLLFFRGAGVHERLTADISERLTKGSAQVNKYEIVRTVLERLNTRGEAALRERREVLRRVVEFSNFDTCWPNDQLKAKGLVAGIREVTNQKDAFTRINIAREEERNLRLTELDRAARERRDRAAKIDSAKQQLYSLFNSTISPQERGKKLETALNNLFSAHDILVRKAFHLIGNSGEGIVEQIDGIIEINSALYFVEMKWYREPVGKPQIAEHLIRLMSRAEARGIFISASDYTDPAIHTAREFLQHKLLVLMTLQEIVVLLEQQNDLAEFIKMKADAAQIEKDPYFRPNICR